MTDQWNLLKNMRWRTADPLETEVDVPNDCIWFTGHFPGEPILPGIALVHLVYEVILQEAQGKGESVRVASLKRVRFTGPVRPGDTLHLSLHGEDSDVEKVYTFKVSVKEQAVCSGQVSVTKNR